MIRKEGCKKMLRFNPEFGHARRSFLAPALRFFLIAIGVLAAHQCLAQEMSATSFAAERQLFRLPSEIPAPPENLPNPERVELGKMLFFDPRLSGSNWISCASCHNPLLGWSDGLPTGVGDGMRALGRKTPSLVNSGFNTINMWDGRAPTLEAQAWTPMLDSAEMHGSQEAILVKLKAIPGYVTAFEKAYPGEGITKETIGKAIASFERTIISRDSPFDRWVAGEDSALSDSAKRGFALFTGKANCTACHQGSNFTDQGFHNLGLKGSADPGRFAIVPVRISRGAFKTPTLRDVTLTAPYMHNGAYRTLDEVIDHYDRGGDAKENLDPNMRPLGLTDQEKRDLVEFLKGLTGKQQPVVLPRLPQ
jgi:cytochrome c peroxidase